MAKRNLRLAGKVSNNEAIPEVEQRVGKFDIKVKNDEGDVVFEQENVEFNYAFVPSLETALKYLGADLSEDQAQFLSEALKGSEKTGEAVTKLLKIFNDNLESTAQRNAYSALYQSKKPRSEESIINTWAAMVRGFVSNTPGSTVQSAIDVLKVAIPGFPQDFTVETYNAAKLPGRKSGN